MDARDLALQLAFGRIAIGTALVVAPGLLARAWVGRDGAAPGAMVVTTGLGAREVALGLGAVRALRGGRDAAPWLRGAALADVADVVATLRARDELPAVGAIGVAALAAGSAALSLSLERALARRRRSRPVASSV
jgi:hypothetical protein